MSPYEMSILCDLARLAIGESELNGRFDAGYKKLQSEKSIRIGDGLRNGLLDDPNVAEFVAWAKREVEDKNAVVSC